MMPLYENIKKFRKERKWTQEELAKKVGYTHRSSIGKIEKGEVDLSQSKIDAFAEAFGVSPQELMGYDISTLLDELQSHDQQKTIIDNHIDYTTFFLAYGRAPTEEEMKQMESEREDVRLFGYQMKDKFALLTEDQIDTIMSMIDMFIEKNNSKE